MLTSRPLEILKIAGSHYNKTIAFADDIKTI
jgi:hypothetical protein